MSVSLCAFRLKLGGDSIVPKDLAYLAPEYLAMEASSKEKSEERLPEAETWERERASKGRGKRELQNIEMETYENENMGTGPWEISKGKNKTSLETRKVRTLSNNSSFYQEIPSTSKEPSPALSSATGDGEMSVSESSYSDLADHKKVVSNRDQLSFFSGNLFVEKVQDILHFYKESHMASLEMDVLRT
ncbi:hypothetical protein GHT06_021339 [Daphnia sinensis]|uniref:Uncharacterized protein n=1 Tax=Daphnia sinensis TaxID=1820382 RepID=A0AAD5KIZ7_9CRUS|nr:hypothetical protein GHT06_021337 [Daphnia sinensis]KAI9553433.1 hypothetical protein GHT06_021339 [Daphnia sinensis]